MKFTEEKLEQAFAKQAKNTFETGELQEEVVFPLF
jgi:hypothetical protein